MPLAQYRKAPLTLRPKPTPTHSKPPKTHHLAAPILVTIGSLMITTAVWPIVQYQLFISPSLKRIEFLSPVPESQLSRAIIPNPQFLSPKGQLASLTVSGMEAETTYTNPRTWFPEADFTPKTQAPSPITDYLLTIPKVDIEIAKVSLAGDDLGKSLIHYPGTAMPGQPGSAVIFGHSILRQFYNPSINNPNRYMSIFSKIMTLKNDDQIYLDIDNIRYTYAVKDKVEVKPEDVFILEQRYGGSDLKLITCIPEGTYLRRGVVIAGLVSQGPIPSESL